MIPARKSRSFESWFARKAERRLVRTFEGLYVRGLEHLRDATREGPVIVVSNHSSWWDGLLALVLIRRTLGADGYALMDAANLQDRPFFALTGAFGVARDDPRDGARALRWAARRLDRPGRVVWIFPQGEERPNGRRPLGFAPGAALLARLAPSAKVVPLSLAYEVGPRERPRAFVVVGAPLAPAPVSEAQAAQEAAVEAGLAKIEAVYTGPVPEAFVRLLGAREGRLAEALLVRLTRRAVAPAPARQRE